MPARGDVVVARDRYLPQRASVFRRAASVCRPAASVCRRAGMVRLAAEAAASVSRGQKASVCRSKTADVFAALARREEGGVKGRVGHVASVVRVCRPGACAGASCAHVCRLRM